MPLKAGPAFAGVGVVGLVADEEVLRGAVVEDARAGADDQLPLPSRSSTTLKRGAKLSQSLG